MKLMNWINQAMLLQKLLQNSNVSIEADLPWNDAFNYYFQKNTDFCVLVDPRHRSFHVIDPLHSVSRGN